LATSRESSVLTVGIDQPRLAQTASHTSAAVSGLFSHSASITACSASLMRSPGSPPVSAISSSLTDDYACNHTDYGCKPVVSMNVFAVRRWLARVCRMDRLRHRVRRLSDCHNIADFRALAKRRLPFPVFHYIDGGGDDEITKDRNTAAFTEVDLVPNV